MRTLPKILFTTPIFGFPSKGGPELRIETSIKALSKISSLYLYIRKHRKDISEISNKFLQNLSNDVYYMERGMSKEECWEHLLKNITPNIIWFGYGNVSYDLMKYIKSITNIPIVCDTDSVWSKFILRELDVENNPLRRNEIKTAGKKKEIEESEWVNFCDVTTAVSKIDMSYYQNLTKEKQRIHLFSNVIDLNSYHNFIENLHNISSPSLFLAGTFWKNAPMEDASRWLISNVLPDLIKIYPQIKLYILGKNSKEIIGDLASKNIEILGEVESVLPYLIYSDIVLVPLRFESGTRFKILEAMACKKAIISTTLGAEGIPIINNINIMIADTKETFLEKIIELLSDSKKRNFLGKEGYKIILKNYNIDSLVEEGKKICQFLGLKK